MARFFLSFGHFLFPDLEQKDQILAFDTVFEGNVEETVIDGSRMGGLLNDFDDFGRDPRRFILEDLFEDLLTKLDFALFICKLGQINLKLKILIGNSHTSCIKSLRRFGLLFIDCTIIMQSLLMLPLNKEYQPIQLIIVKDLNLMFVVGDEEV